MQLRAPLSAVGVFIGALFFAFSLAPSLLPRPFPFQAAVSGLSLALGYALCCAGCWLWSYLELPRAGARAGRLLRLAAAVVGTAVTAVFVWRAAEWQNSVRALMGLGEANGIGLLRVGLVALSVFAALLLLARLFHGTFLFLSGKLHPFLPRRVANAVSSADSRYRRSTASP